MEILGIIKHIKASRIILEKPLEEDVLEIECNIYSCWACAKQNLAYRHY